MNIYIVGKGAIGMFLGEKLAAVGVNVEYAPRSLEAVTAVAADVAIVTTKAYDSESAIATLQKAVLDPKNCVFVTPQNGVGNEELLASAFGADNVVAAALTVPVSIDAGGKPVAENEGGLALAPFGASAFNWLTATFASTGLNVRVVDDAAALKWSKLALNVIANASCAILDMMPNQLVAHKALFDLELRMVREVRDVMKAMNAAPIDLPRYPTRALFAGVSLPNPLARALIGGRIAGGRGTKPPSLLLDLRQGKAHTEVGVLNGAVAAKAAEMGVSVPVNATYARLLENIAQSPQHWENYRGRPDALVAQVEGATLEHARP